MSTPWSMFLAAFLIVLLSLVSAMPPSPPPPPHLTKKISPQRQAQIDIFRTYSPNSGEDVKYNSVSQVMQMVKKEISEADPTLLPVKELRRIFFETLVGPVQRFENEFNEILSDFVLLRDNFKEYLFQFLDFNSDCTDHIYLKSTAINNCFEHIPKLIQQLEKMDQIVNRILTREEFDKRLNVIQKIISSENLKIQEIEASRYKEYQEQWIKMFAKLDLRGLEESKDQLFRVEQFLLDFSTSFQKFKTFLKIARNHLWEVQQVIALEAQISSYEKVISDEGLENMLEYLWDANFKSYNVMKLMVQPDPSEVVVSLPERDNTGL